MTIRLSQKHLTKPGVNKNENYTTTANCLHENNTVAMRFVSITTLSLIILCAITSRPVVAASNSLRGLSVISPENEFCRALDGNEDLCLSVGCGCVAWVCVGLGGGFGLEVGLCVWCCLVFCGGDGVGFGVCLCGGCVG